MPVRIADIPENDRPRERLARIGSAGLSDSELLALVIRAGGSGGNALHLAQAILAHYGSLAETAQARLDELARFVSMGKAKAAALVAAFELGRRAAHPSQPPSRISGPDDIARIVLLCVSERGNEETFIVSMNIASRLLRVQRLTLGTSDRALLSVRQALNAALQHGAASFAVVHTHPSGDPTPSREDIEVTHDLAAGALAAGLTFSDHIVIAGNRWISLRALGYIGA